MNSLEQQFIQLINIVNDLQQRVITLENVNHALIQSNKQLLEQITIESQTSK